MKTLQKGLYVEGITAFLLALLLYFVVRLDNAMYILILPFDLIGRGLQWLSINSSIGNILALILYATLSLLPVIYLLIKRHTTVLKTADIFFPIISLYSFYMLYEFINPGLMLKRVPEILADNDVIPMLKLSFVILFYTLCISYFIFQMLDHLAVDKKEDRRSFLCKKLKFILVLISLLYTFVLGYFLTFVSLTDFFKYLNQTNSTINCTFVVLSYVSSGLPILFAIIIVFAAVQLLSAMDTNHMQEEEIQAATQLGYISKRAVIVTVLCDITINVLQFTLTKYLSDTSYTLRISFIPLIIAFVAVILSSYFKESKELYEDNEMII